MAGKVPLMVAMVAVMGVATADISPYRPPAPHTDPYKAEGMPHQFQYQVKDDYTGTDFGHSEDSDGKKVRGSYTVQLPDGRKQTVNYEADHYNGYQAQVEYYGEAQYPHEYGPPVTFKPQYSSHQPSYQPPKPSYQPEPSYQPPQPSYQPPQPLYQPEPSYQPPQPSYQPPQPSYQPAPEPIYT